MTACCARLYLVFSGTGFPSRRLCDHQGGGGPMLYELCRQRPAAEVLRLCSGCLKAHPELGRKRAEEAHRLSRRGLSPFRRCGDCGRPSTTSTMPSSRLTAKGITSPASSASKPRRKRSRPTLSPSAAIRGGTPLPSWWKGSLDHFVGRVLDLLEMGNYLSRAG